MNAGGLYYTDNRLAEPIYSIVQRQLPAWLPIVSVSLKPIPFGKNIVLDLAPCYLTMLRQILAGLEASTADYVFFCEHDVLYPAAHFDSAPPRDDLFYYDSHVWRWDYPTDRAISYDRLISLSGLCANRRLLLNHYRARLDAICRMGWDKVGGRDPNWARKWGYEPGTKTRRRGGFSDEGFETYKAAMPMVDIRHSQTFSPRKAQLSSFRHPPVGWRETTIDQIPGWKLKEMFRCA